MRKHPQENRSEQHRYSNATYLPRPYSKNDGQQDDNTPEVQLQRQRGARNLIVQKLPRLRLTIIKEYVSYENPVYHSIASLDLTSRRRLHPSLQNA